MKPANDRERTLERQADRLSVEYPVPNDAPDLEPLYDQDADGVVRELALVEPENFDAGWIVGRGEAIAEVVP
jgi:hypothetical protein